MEPLWSPVVATGGNRSQIASPRNLRRQAKTVAVGCDQLPIAAHGKEGVGGSIPPSGSSCRLYHMNPPYRTSGGRILTEEELDTLVAEAEHGYDVEELARDRRLLALQLSRQSSPLVKGR
jgi:hypothetical protein